MKKYKLLKDLPFAKAGDIFKGELECGTIVLFPEDYENYKHKLNSDEFWDFDEWFEEVVEEFYYIDEKGIISTILEDSRHTDILLRQAIGNYFKTKEEAEKYLEYLKAKEVIKQDTNGFKADWNNENKIKYSAHWSNKANRSYVCRNTDIKNTTIYFETEEDIKESLEKHPNEWKAYLLYGQ